MFVLSAVTDPEMWQSLSLSSTAVIALFVTLVSSGPSKHSLVPPPHHNAWNQRPLAADREETAASRYWLDEQDHTGNARGYAPFLGNDFTYPVYRNVRAYGALGNGIKDDTDALQNAINTDGKGGTRYKNEVTTRPAEVFVPGGTYKISKTIDLRLNTILVGDPNNRPIFKAAANFGGESLINGYDFATDGTAGTTNFLVAIKNVVIDTTNINKDRGAIALNWGVAQACHLTNIRILMPNNSGAHIGIAIDQGSTISIGDIEIVGGAVGIRNKNQQVNFKNISFRYCTTALAFGGGFTAVIQGASFDTCGLGVDATGAGQLGSVIILDSTSVNSGPTIKFRDTSRDSGPRNNQVVIENLSHSGNNPVAIAADGSTRLQRISPLDTWLWGNVEPGTFRTGQTLRLVVKETFWMDGWSTYRPIGQPDLQLCLQTGNSSPNLNQPTGILPQGRLSMSRPLGVTRKSERITMFT